MKLILIFVICFSTNLLSAEKKILQKANNNLNDQASLQRGAMLFMNYCSGCHSMQYQRYQSVARDIGIPDELMENNLIFDKNSKIGDLILSSLDKSQAEQWFGGVIPDLTMITRVKGVDWVFTYLNSFYKDNSRPFGVNNIISPNINMPHVLEELQGTTELNFKEKLIDGKIEIINEGIKSKGNGRLNEDEYLSSIRDLVNYLEYSSDPSKLKREKLGIWVMSFLILLIVFTFLLKKEFWKDIK